jgi:thiamine biosynthesis lipoprotein
MLSSKGQKRRKGHKGLLSLLSLLSFSSLSAIETRFDFESVQMATKFRLSLHAENRETAEKAAEDAFAHVSHLTGLFSDYEPNSELNRLNASKPNEPFQASPELVEIITRSLEISQLTDGAFDITCGHLTRLWRSMKNRKQLPPPERLAAAKAAMDWQAVKVDAQASTITLMKPGMLLDLGGIAKGYAADAVLKRLRERHHITRALVIAGGDIAIGDPPPGKDGWDVKLRSSAEAETTVILKNAAVSTSGDMYQAITLGDTRYAHIISPSTGLGLTQTVSCSVIAPDGTTSDALATAMVVLGKEKGSEIAKKIPGITLKWGD